MTSPLPKARSGASGAVVSSGMWLFGRACLGVVSTLAATLVTFVLPNPAHACSCLPFAPPAEAIGMSPVAFTGRVVDADPPPPPPDMRGSGEPIEYTIEIIDEIKGDLGETVPIVAGHDGNCGITLQVGQELGFVPGVWEKWWSVSGCGGTYVAEDLRNAPRVLPQPTSSGPIALLAAGQQIDSSITAFDDQGRAVGYVFTGGIRPTSIAACPGGETAVALAPGERTELMTIDLRTLSVTAQHTLDPNVSPDFNWYSVRDLTCLADDGSRTAVLVPGVEWNRPDLSAILVLTDGVVETFNTPSAVAMAASGGENEIVWVEGGKDGGAVFASNVVTGDTRQIAAVDPTFHAVSVTVERDSGTVAVAVSNELVDGFSHEVTSIARWSPDGAAQPPLTIAPVLSPSMRWTPAGFAVLSGYNGTVSLLSATDGSLIASLQNGTSATALRGRLVASARWENTGLRWVDGNGDTTLADVYDVRDLALVEHGVSVDSSAVRLAGPEVELVPGENAPSDLTPLGTAAVAPRTPATASAPRATSEDAPQLPEGGATVKVDRGEGRGLPIGWVLAGVFALVAVLGVTLVSRHRAQAAPGERPE